MLIIGGGVNGAGLFLDLALQGVDVLLIDKSDYCTGSSAASSRMIHGGLRYLEFGEFRLVKEALKDRNLLLQNAPHYVFPLPTTIPIFKWVSGAVSSVRKFLGLGGDRPANRGAVMVKTGLMFYDIFTRKNRLMPKHKFTSRANALAKRPLLHPDVLMTATYYDAWISYPERLCIELLMDGQQLCQEADTLNYTTIQNASGETVLLRDELSGETFEVKPKAIVNATGGWIDFTNKQLGLETQLIGGTKGGHLVVDNEQLYHALGGEMIYYETADGRVAVALPWLGKSLIGSTDIRVGNPDDVRCTEDEVDYILESICQVFPTLNLDRSHIVSRFSGVRPLRHSDASATVQVSRDHHCEVIEPADDIKFPVYCMTGGKWTTFRAFAEQVTDRLLGYLDKTRRGGTTDLPIGGGRGFPKSNAAKRGWLADLHARIDLPENRLSTLLERYGTRAEQMATFCTAEPDAPLQHHTGYTRREIEFIIQHEGVMRPDDLVLRRTAIALTGELLPELLRELIAIMAPLRGWSEEDVQAETERTADILQDRFGIDCRSA